MRRTPALLLLVGSLMVFASAGYGFLHARVRPALPLSLPADIAGAPMTAKQEGWRAIESITYLHHQDFPLAAGAVGYYGLNHDATLWVARASSEWAASRMANAMATTIGRSESPFKPTNIRHHDDHHVHELTGMGQTHFYFQSGDLIVWLDVHPELAEPGLQQVMAFYP